jgi:hypothetical protein
MAPPAERLAAAHTRRCLRGRGPDRRDEVLDAHAPVWPRGPGRARECLQRAADVRGRGSARGPGPTRRLQCRSPQTACHRPAAGGRAHAGEGAPTRARGRAAKPSTPRTSQAGIDGRRGGRGRCADVHGVGGYVGAAREVGDGGAAIR